MNKSKRVKVWRKNTKIRIIEAMGNRCQCCGYSLCNDALELHHIDPKSKDFSFGSVTSNPKKWETIKAELKKCVLLCSVCHREVHAGIRMLPETYAVFDETKILTKPINSICAVCHTSTAYLNATCSHACASKLANVDWSKINLEYELRTQTVTQVAFKFYVTASLIRRRIRNLGLSAAKIRSQYPEVKTAGIRTASLLRRRMPRPSKEQLASLILAHSFTKLGKMFNVSDNTIRKWCSFYSLELPSRDAVLWR